MRIANVDASKREPPVHTGFCFSTSRTVRSDEQHGLIERCFIEMRELQRVRLELLRQEAQIDRALLDVFIVEVVLFMHADVRDFHQDVHDGRNAIRRLDDERIVRVRADRFDHGRREELKRFLHLREGQRDLDSEFVQPFGHVGQLETHAQLERCASSVRLTCRTLP